ncbi:hypothetical protein GP2143_14326 [marine gamma proteobacterium HTCC2143]|uniref:Uncharacterized protein n=1 Tax=marine gamma proteobacterium HTCC2143 TaxID=247633 RepID=A0Y8I5_9GAMM|nr:hypothetical protein GP2143_14326 [marine gamma proteobacterium HTCC2143]
MIRGYKLVQVIIEAELRVADNHQASMFGLIFPSCARAWPKE